jgi:hypothetical protein
MRLSIFAFLVALCVRQREQLMYTINISNYECYRFSAYILAIRSKYNKASTCRRKHKVNRPDTYSCLVRIETQFFRCLKTKCTYKIWSEIEVNYVIHLASESTDRIINITCDSGRL